LFFGHENHSSRLTSSNFAAIVGFSQIFFEFSFKAIIKIP